MQACIKLAQFALAGLQNTSDIATDTKAPKAMLDTFPIILATDTDKTTLHAISYLRGQAQDQQINETLTSTEQ